MKKSTIVLCALTFLLAITVSSLTWADRGQMEEGSGMKASNPAQEESSGTGMDNKEYQDKKHSKDYKADQAAHLEEGSGGMQSQDQHSGAMKVDKASGSGMKMKSSAPMREGS